MVASAGLAAGVCADALPMRDVMPAMPIIFHVVRRESRVGSFDEGEVMGRQFHSDVCQNGTPQNQLK